MIRLISWFQRALYPLRFAIQFRSITLGRALARNQLTPAFAADVERTGEDLIFKRSQARIPIQAILPHKQATKYLFKILNTAGAQPAELANGSIKLRLEGVNLQSKTASNAFAVNEVFFERIYDVLLPDRKLLVIDIGMNVGVASLFFASNDRVQAVVGYEPFPETFSAASENFTLNPLLAHKLHPRNLGVSARAQRKRVSQPEAGLLSASTIQQASGSDTREGNSVEIQLISISDALQHARANFPGLPIVLKVDCEGEEYPIFESLAGTEILRDVMFAIIEWHEAGPDGITKVLQEQGFAVLPERNPGASSGLIYAFRC